MLTPGRRERLLNKPGSDEIAQLRQALLPFARIWAINAPLNPDPARPVSQFIAGAWPSMADAKRAYDLAMIRTNFTTDAEEAAKLRALVKRLTDVAEDLARVTPDPGTEALAAIYCGRHLIYG